MEIKSLVVQKSARYVTLGNPEAGKLLFVLHGYGQLAEYFAKHFKQLIDLGFYIVVPEGLHRFYLGGSSGRVGASWMTKELRELDIEENFNYLENLLTEINSKNQFSTISLLGFSQGGSTAARWFAKSSFTFSQFVLWASIFPPDLNLDFQGNQFKSVKKQFVIGNEDPYFKNENYAKIVTFYQSSEFEIIEYEGTHTIDLKTLLLLFK